MSSPYAKSKQRLTEDDYKQFLANMGKVGSGVDGLKRSRTEQSVPGASPGLLAIVDVRAAHSQFKSDPPPTKREYDSKWEEAYASELVLRKHAGLIKAYWYHPFSMWLPGKVRYSPDFMIEYPWGLEKRLEIVEVKGWSKNLRDGMTRLKIAAAIFPCFTWKLVKKQKGGGWSETSIG